MKFLKKLISIFLAMQVIVSYSAAAAVPWNKLFKRELLINNGLQIPEGAKIYHDMSFNYIGLPQSTRVVCVEKQLYNYTGDRPSSLITSANLKTRAEHVRFFANLMCSNWQKNGYSKEHEPCLLRRIIQLKQGVINKLSGEDKQAHARALLKVLGPEIYNCETVRKCNWLTKQRLREAVNTARGEH